ncbi:MAG: hypothetical protein A2328_03940 [Bdellovibrionales bacterium RIFOXYB2_FULL_36_6]|nr:MAG: hypothetical protein A2328_03940 [Bdellovibrionales bacterium RIFOXYB2_FULL_36_6]
MKRYIFASTIYVYSDSGSFYRASKQSCELFIESYQKEYGIDFTILRYGSLYGPRSDETNWIQHVIKAALNDGKIVRKGDGEEIREYIHVKDAALLTVKMMDEEYKNQYAVITGQQTMKIKDVLTLINEIMGNKLKIKFVKEGNEGHYEITPYSFKPKFAKKITSNSFVDFGQGILELLDLEYKKGNPHQQ